MSPSVAFGDLDLAIISTCRAGPGLHLEKWVDEELVAVLPQRHALAAREAIEWPELQGETVLLLHESHCLSRRIQKGCAQHKVACKAAGVLQLQTLLQLVAAGQGISLLPRMAVGQLVRGVVSRPFRKMMLQREINLLRNTSHYQSKAALAVAALGRTLLCESVGSRL